MSSHEGYVYFIQVGEIGPIKIGRTRDPEGRFNDLQLASPFDLKLRLLLFDEWLEPLLHEKFAECRIRGEWFYPFGDLQRYIARLASDPDTEVKVFGNKVPSIQDRDRMNLPLGDGNPSFERKLHGAMFADASASLMKSLVDKKFRGASSARKRGRPRLMSLGR